MKKIKTNKLNLQSFDWSTFYVDVYHVLLSKYILISTINRFWDEIVSKVHDENKKHIMLIPRIIFDNDQIVTLSNLLKLNISDKELLEKYLSNILSINIDQYLEIPIKAIIFDYTIREGLAPNNNIEIKNENWAIKKRIL